ncbi:MAG: restriction endonuclease subunit S [Fibrobacter sp.]|nr:restriction endonuclease subunit S [Fibrobacter sp.]
MALKTYKLGELIEPSDERNSDGKYGIDDVKGISIQKIFIETKADMAGVSLSPYLLVKPDYFAYVTVTSRNGEKITLAHNKTSETYIVSSSYVVFRIKKTDILLSDYLFIYFNRPEFDRFSRFNSWGSARETFSWADLCDIDITLPDKPTQQKYVDIYESMAANQKSYEKGLNDLKLTCDAYIEELRRKTKCEKIGPYIKKYSEKNTDKKVNEVVGLSTSKQFRIAQSRVNRDELGGYKILHPLDFAYVPTTDTWKVLAFAVNHFEKDVVVSPIYEVFTMSEKLNPDYLAMWMKREEFDRYARYNSWGSARENFTFDEMQNVEIPIPDKKIQESIVDIYLAYETRKRINEQLKQQIKDICPILIKGSLEE